MKKKYWSLGIGAMLLTIIVSVSVAFSNRPSTPNPNLVTVYKTPTCGCCGKWVDHLKADGFDVRVYERPSLEVIRSRYGVPDHLASCHTAHISGYTIEGHVPGQDIRRLLSEKPKVIGLSVPGMTVGSPGMEMEGRSDPFNVIAFSQDQAEVFNAYNSAQQSKSEQE